MQIYSIQTSFKRKGHTIIRPNDRSCWLLVSPCGRYRSQYWTRADAIAAADAKAALAAETAQLGPFAVAETVDGRWLVTCHGVQWGDPPFDASGCSSQTWDTRRGAVAAIQAARATS